MTFDLWLSISVTALGLVMGSAVTALAHRVPRGISWVHGRSACPSCGATLGVPDLVPVVSWIAARGRCRHCGAGVSARYPVTELWCGAWALLLYRHVGLGWDYPFLALWGFLLVALTWIDFDVQLLPDVLTFPGVLVGLAAALQWPGGVRDGLFGIVLGSGSLWLLGEFWLRVRKVEGMGFGDVKLAAMLGVVLGWKLMFLTLLMAALAGSAWGMVLMSRGLGDGKTELPFGTLLAPAAMIAFLWGGSWVEGYLGLLTGN